MSKSKYDFERYTTALHERMKELRCLYNVESAINHSKPDAEDTLRSVLEVIPDGWQYPDYCQVKIEFNSTELTTEGFRESPWKQTTLITVQGRPVGSLEVSYTKEFPPADSGPFLREEEKLLETIADRLGHLILQQQLVQRVKRWEIAKKQTSQQSIAQWRVIVDLLRRTDQDLFLRIARKMMNYLCWNGIKQADTILQQWSLDRKALSELEDGGNRPVQKKKIENQLTLSQEIFDVAADYLKDSEILSCVRRWIHEDKSGFLVRTVINLESSLEDITDAILRFRHQQQESTGLSDSIHKGLRVSLVRRFLSDQLEFIRIAKNYVEISDFVELIPRLIYPQGSHGKLGGKGSGMFLASLILKKKTEEHPELNNVRIPKTWYVTSDGMHNFMSLNNLEEVTEQKYKEIGQVRQEYPHIIQLFKSSRFPPEIVNGLSMALDDFGDTPLIVRSSSLLEDRLGTAFSGKYVSLFLANQGTKQERLEALLDAMAEVYASTFGADPIEYRSERDLLDFHEQMGILLQEVVGVKAGKYYLPAYAGVAFSNNEFRWSPRIKREDGLVRIVPGLGTRAVDRLSDDYPILVAPGQPGLRVNVTVEEAIRYSPNKMDVINLETNEFETIDVHEFLASYGHDIPGIEKLISVIRDGKISKTNRFNLDFEHDELLVNFESLIDDTPFIQQMKSITTLLSEALETPVDIEFASDGTHFYLLQCRPQSYSIGDIPQPIPKDIPEESIIFSANRYVSNGQVPDVTHIVYIDPVEYGNLQSREELLAVGRAVGKLNMLLPKRHFILMGPGRWGSRGDIKLGVNVTYSDISNTAMLIEIARKKGNYVPDLSFGTHFFQDLVESGIRYLPLYPDESGILFHERFLLKSTNILPDILPGYSSLDKVIRIVDVPSTTGGKVLKVLMNAELDEAVGILTQAESVPQSRAIVNRRISHDEHSDDHWRWRYRMVEQIASHLDPEKYGIKALYVFGSTKNATAGPGSDIDLLLHIDEQKCDRELLLEWLEGWSLCLDEMNFLKTGYRGKGLLDVHFVTDEDIAKRTSYASKIGAITDSAREIPISRRLK